MCTARLGWMAGGPAVTSAAELRREIHKVLGHDVPIARWGQVAGLAGAVLRWSRDEGGAKPAAGGGGKISIVGRHHHALLRAEAEQVDGAEVRLGLRLVVSGDLGAEHGVPGESGALGHVDDQ